MRLLAVLLLTCTAACGTPDVPPASLSASEPTTYYVRAGGNSTLYFRTTIKNETDSVQTVYCFAYASDNTAQPPARSVYPPRALNSMPRDRRFAVGSPDVGILKTIAPGDTASFSGALPLPTVWPDGQQITVDAFREFTLYLYNKAGRNVLRETWKLDRR